MGSPSTCERRLSMVQSMQYNRCMIYSCLHCCQLWTVITYKSVINNEQCPLQSVTCFHAKFFDLWCWLIRSQINTGLLLKPFSPALLQSPIFEYKLIRNCMLLLHTCIVTSCLLQCEVSHWCKILDSVGQHELLTSQYFWSVQNYRFWFILMTRTTSEKFRLSSFNSFWDIHVKHYLIHI